MVACLLQEKDSAAKLSAKMGRSAQHISVCKTCETQNDPPAKNVFFIGMLGVTIHGRPLSAVPLYLAVFNMTLLFPVLHHEEWFLRFSWAGRNRDR